MDDETRDRLAENRAHWDELAAHHPDTEYYDVPGFLDGESSLQRLEREELADVVGAGTRLLHLQCHFGMDTLSWAREGATVVGADFSGTAIETARELAAEAGLGDRATFVESDLYDLPANLDGEFDVVFTSYGVLTWLPDLDRWGDVIAHFLAPGGTFYIAESHPFTEVFHEASTAEDLRVGYPYFEGSHLSFDDDGSYADYDLETEHTRTHEFSHSLAEVVNALLDAGLRLEFLHEHPFAAWRMVEAMEEDDEGRWWLPGLDHDLPFTFSIRARMPGA